MHEACVRSRLPARQAKASGCAAPVAAVAAAQSIGSLSPPPPLPSPRPGWGGDKCTLGPQAKLIHLPSFSSGLRSGSCWEWGGSRGVLVPRQDVLLLPHVVVVFFCSSLAPPTSTPPLLIGFKSLSRRARRRVPSWKLAQGQACRFTTGTRKWIFAFILTTPSVSITPFNHTLFMALAL